MKVNVKEEKMQIKLEFLGIKFMSKNKKFHE